MPRAAALAVHAERELRPLVAWTLPWNGSTAPREAAVGQCSSAWRSGRGQRVPHHGNRLLRAVHCVFEHVGPGSAGDRFALNCGDFNLAGDVLEQSGWLHAVRACIAAPSNDTPTCLDSTGKGKVIDFFVVSEELHPFVRTVVAGRLCQRWRE